MPSFVWYQFAAVLFGGLITGIVYVLRGTGKTLASQASTAQVQAMGAGAAPLDQSSGVGTSQERLTLTQTCVLGLLAGSTHGPCSPGWICGIALGTWPLALVHFRTTSYSYSVFGYHQSR